MRGAYVQAQVHDSDPRKYRYVSPPATRLRSPELILYHNIRSHLVDIRRMGAYHNSSAQGVGNGLCNRVCAPHKTAEVGAILLYCTVQYPDAESSLKWYVKEIHSPLYESNQGTLSSFDQDSSCVEHPAIPCHNLAVISLPPWVSESDGWPF
jgi:hypothetical protein